MERQLPYLLPYLLTYLLTYTYRRSYEQMERQLHVHERMRRFVRVADFLIATALDHAALSALARNRHRRVLLRLHALRVQPAHERLAAAARQDEPPRLAVDRQRRERLRPRGREGQGRELRRARGLVLARGKRRGDACVQFTGVVACSNVRMGRAHGARACACARVQVA